MKKWLYSTKLINIIVFQLNLKLEEEGYEFTGK